MRVLVQSGDNLKFLANDGDWVTSVEAAKDVPVAALGFYIARHFSGGPFRVMLHSPETGELIHFVEGMGRAARFANSSSRNYFMGPQGS